MTSDECIAKIEDIMESNSKGGWKLMRIGGVLKQYHSQRTVMGDVKEVRPS